MTIDTNYAPGIDIAATRDGEDILAAQRAALATMLARANGGTPPDRIVLRMAGDPPAADGSDALTVVRYSVGVWAAELGIATHWTRLLYPNFRLAVTPSSDIVLLGNGRGGQLHAWIEDGRLHLDRGSPLLSAHEEGIAAAAFDAAVTALMAEAA